METILDRVERDLLDELRDGDRTLDEDLHLALHEHICPRCHHDVDDEGYCSMCGAACGRCGT